MKEGRGIGIKFGGGPTESEGKQEMQEIQGQAKKTLLSSVTHVTSGLMGCVSAALG